MSSSQTQQIRALSLSKAPHAIGVVFWLGFTSLHAYFMLSGVLRSSERGALLFLIPFYALFFGVGFWMLRGWLRWRALTRRYGTAVIEQVPHLELGEQSVIHVRFNHAWPTDVLAAHPLSGTLKWQKVDSDGDPVGTVHSIPVALQTTPAGDHTAVRVNVSMPQSLPADALTCKYVELLLETAPGQGWRFVLPFAPKQSAFSANEPPRAATLDATQAANAKRVLGIIAALVISGAVVLAIFALMASHFSFFRLAFAVPLTYIGVLLWSVRKTISLPANAAPGDDLAVQTSALSVRVKRVAPIIGVVMFAAFVADIFVPKDFSRRITTTFVQKITPGLGAKRPTSPVTFMLPAHLFNAQMAMQVTTQGTASLQQNSLTLNLETLELTELLNHDTSNRLVHSKLGLEVIKDDGDHVRAVSDEVTLPYSNPQRAHSVRLTNVQAKFTLEPTADLSQIWLRLKVYSDRGYAPIDASVGHIAQALAQTDAAFSTCGGMMSIRTAIARRCNDQLAQTLAAPHWQLWERVARWRAQAPLIHHALSEGNAQAVSVLHKAGIGIEDLDEKGRTALMMAAWNNQLDFVDALLAAGANPLYYTEASKHSALTGSLYDHHLASARKLFKSPRDLEDHLKRWNHRAEHRVAMDGHIQTLQMLLDAGVPVNSANVGSSGRGETLLMAAARSKTNSIEMLRILLERGAQLNALDAHGKNATDWAEFFGNADASDFLCARGLEPTALDAGGQNNEKRKRANCQAPSAARS